MPVAGEEGYEEKVICPYDRSHEIRRGRMQFHLNKCRKNHPCDEMVQCVYNAVHIIPKVEEQFHTEEECLNKCQWDSHTFEIGDVDCPVKDLVPINAATVSDGGENWDTYETTGSVLNSIKSGAAEKNIFRMLQCEPKSKRKMFREEEKLRHSNLSNMQFEDVATVSSDYEPLRRPARLSTVPVTRQDPKEAVAAMNKQFRTLDLNIKPSTSNYAASDTSSMYNGPPSTIKPVEHVHSQPSEESRPSTSMSSAISTRSHYAASDTSSMYNGPMSTIKPVEHLHTQPNEDSRPSTSMSSAISTRSRMSTAASIAESADRVKQSEDEAFCQIPIPGRGRGARLKQNKP